MIKKVLIVDDDQELLTLLAKGLEKYSRVFSILTAEDGLVAIELLKKNNFSLVVTDLEMPRIDGLSLLTHLKEHYPDIQTLIITGYSTPAKEEYALGQGVSAYIKKPFSTEDLSRHILAALKREADGGVLNGISPGTFLQLLEMEQKTCTIRLIDNKSGNQGSLFFKEGELLDARFNEVYGRDAAYKILSWEEATLSIQESCSVTENKIQADLQAVLLEAMRQKDEIQTEEKMTQEEIDAYILYEKQTSEFEIKLNGEEHKSSGEGDKAKVELKTIEQIPAPSDRPKKETVREIGSGGVSHGAALDGPAISYTMADNIFGILAGVKAFVLGSTVFKYIFRALALCAVIFLMGLIYLFITLETEKDLLGQIELAKAHISSGQEAINQIDKEIQEHYTVREESINSNDSQLVFMELDLKISELEERQEKILAETKVQQKTLKECQVRLKAMRRASLFDRLLENAEKYMPRDQDAGQQDLPQKNPQTNEPISKRPLLPNPCVRLDHAMA